MISANFRKFGLTPSLKQLFINLQKIGDNIDLQNFIYLVSRLLNFVHLGGLVFKSPVLVFSWLMAFCLEGFKFASLCTILLILTPSFLSSFIISLHSH